MYTVICLICVVTNIRVQKSVTFFLTSANVYMNIFNNDIWARWVNWSYACACSGVVSIYYIGELDKWLNEELAS